MKKRRSTPSSIPLGIPGGDWTTGRHSRATESGPESGTESVPNSRARRAVSPHPGTSRRAASADSHVAPAKRPATLRPLLSVSNGAPAACQSAPVADLHVQTPITASLPADSELPASELFTNNLDVDDMALAGERSTPISENRPARSAVELLHALEPQDNPAGDFTSSGMDNGFDPSAVWQMVLSELAMQMPPSTYDTWVRDTVVLGYEDGEFLIGLPNAYARDWAENRLRHSIKRTLSSILQRSVQVKFRIRPKAQLDEELGDAPLYQSPAAPITAALEPNLRDGNSVQAPSLWDNRAATPDHRSQPAAPFQGTTGSAGENHTLPKLGPKQSGQPASPRPSGVRAKSPLDSMDAMQEQIYKAPNLNPTHTFDTFVVGNHNRLAHAAALAIVDAPGQAFNPLFIYGGVGLGKTHLLHAIGNSMAARGLKLLYCSSEQFTNDLISAIRTQTTEEFRNKYRQIDILLIDDIQFIAGKETTQEEFFHTFNHLHAAGRQVVLSSDRPPKALPLLEERLRSRFEGGLQTDIGHPDFETRVAILQSKANRMGIPVSYEVLLLVAEQVDSNIRELEGALNRLFMQARLADCQVTLGFARTILEDLSPQRSPCTPLELLKIVADHFGLRPDDLTGRKRTKEIAYARQIAMYLLREEHDLSLPAIGGHLGGRDHSTVRYGVSSVTEDLKNDESLRMTVMTLREKVYAPSA